jgi:hypothetical protein
MTITDSTAIAKGPVRDEYHESKPNRGIRLGLWTFIVTLTYVKSGWKLLRVCMTCCCHAYEFKENVGS